MSIELTENGIDFMDQSPYKLEISVYHSGGIVLPANAWCRALFGEESFAMYHPTKFSHWEVWRNGECFKVKDELACLYKCLEFVRNQMIKNGVNVPDVRFMEHLLPDELPISGGKIAKSVNVLVERFNEELGPKSTNLGSIREDALLEDALEGGCEDDDAKFDPVNKPQHYNQCRVECIDILEDLGLLEDYARGNAIKYLWRMGDKGNAAQDARKAAWYANRLAEYLEKKESA